MTSLEVYRGVLSRDWLYRWLVIAATAVVAAIGVYAMQLNIDDQRWRPVLQVIFVFWAGGLIFAALALRIRSLTFVLSACADFFDTVSQWLVFALAGLVLTYVAASANFPLMDEVFASWDATMGFHWADTYAWVQRHPVIQTVLWTAYGGGAAQLVTFFLIHSVRAPGNGSGELMWMFMVSLLITIAISVILPAAALPGTIGQRHIDVFLGVRNGHVTVLNASTITGIISFPSFHTASAAILIYSARAMKWLLAVIVPLNVLVILATVPCGGHYLVDTIAGLAVAAISILIVRNMRSSIVVGESNSAAARRADASGQA